MVGSATAFALTVRGVCAEIVLIDYNKEKAVGEALDLQHSIEYQNRNVRVKAGDYSDCGDADIVVITASIPMKGHKVERRDAPGQYRYYGYSSGWCHGKRF